MDQDSDGQSARKSPEKRQNLRQRVQNTPKTDSEDDRVVTEENIGRYVHDLPQASDNTVGWLDKILAPLNPRWRNWVVRGIFSWLMIGGFVWIIRMGPLALMVTEFLQFLVVKHRMISFLLYCVGFVWFVLSLRKGYYMRQFSLFAWTHVTLVLIVTQSYLIIQNIFQGLIWLLVPVSMIICCDIMSYMFGFFFGKTPLIQLSPKKTWEGFLGGALATLIFGAGISYWLLRYPFFVCPLEYSDDAESFTSDCVIPDTFLLQEFGIPRPLSYIFMLAGKRPRIMAYPFLLHTLVMGLFSSLIGPFGGFFASGFKRAFKIKDFGDVIPGHGGLMDRFDCQLLMGTFVNVYIHTFIKTPNPAKAAQQIMRMRPDHALEVYNLLRDALIREGLINATMGYVV